MAYKLGDNRYVKQWTEQQYSKGVLIVLRFDHYGHTMKMLQEIYAEAEKDFAGLRPENVEVIQYGGDRISGYWGLEFQWLGDVPPTYEHTDIIENYR